MLTQTEKNALLQPVQDAFDKMDAKIQELEERLSALENPKVANSTKESKKAA